MNFLRGAFVPFLIVFFSFLVLKVEASHLRAAEFSATRVSGLTYNFRLTLFKSLDLGAQDVEMSIQFIEILGQIYSISRTDSLIVGSSSYLTQINTYDFSFTFPSTNSLYTVSYTEDFRNADILNINGGKSGEIPLHVNIKVFTEGCSGVNCEFNNSPVMSVPPIDEAVVGQVYTHNPGAWDADGDSVSYRLVEPRRAVNQVVSNYLSPSNAQFGGASNLSLNPITGDLIWDSPKRAGIYNIAIEISEWGTSPLGAYLKSVTIRDMQINVVESDNEAPILNLPSDTCVEAGKRFTSIFKGFDPNGDRLSQTAYGAPFDEFGANVIPYWSSTRVVLDSGLFSWQPTCNLARETPYQALYKLTDNNPSPLSTLKSWNIQVNLPAPENLKTESQGNEIVLSWDDYLCENTLNYYNLYRLSCDSSNFRPTACFSGVSDDWGFDLLSNVNKTELSYKDASVEVGGIYCYILTAVDNSGLESLASDMSCANIGLHLPLLTQVSVEVTDKTAGEISVQWIKPLDLDTVVLAGPYTYELYRSNDIEGLNFGIAPIFSITTDNQADTLFQYFDQNLNTQELPYSYRIDFLNDGSKQGSSQVSSYIRLQGESKFRRAELSIDSRVVWQFPDSLMQLVYRITDTDTIVFDTLYGNPNGQAIYDLNNGETYCFFIETRGVYCNSILVDGYLINRSNTVCVVPDDFNPPCPPILSMDTLDCSRIDENTVFDRNNLTWTNDFKKAGCEDDIQRYTLYFQESLDTDFSIIADLDSLTFDYSHFMENSRAGCYYVTATDMKGLESDRSNVACNDNCEIVEFPNVFTPNGDGKNDFFRPFQSERNVKSIDFEVYNRLGKLVFKSTENPDIAWDGNNFSGEQLSAGIYYYSAIVTFYKLETEKQDQVYKGWVLIQR